MSKKPKFDEIDTLLNEGRNFELTDNQYYTKTGAHIPLNKSYTQNKSAVAKLAKKYGYLIKMEPAKLYFVKMT